LVASIIVTKILYPPTSISGTISYPPKTDTERAFYHYGTDETEYAANPELYLPVRGTRRQ
jgi:hypothetical protein